MRPLTAICALLYVAILSLGLSLPAHSADLSSVLPAEGSANVLLANGGRTTAGVTLTVPVGAWHVGGVDGRWYADVMFAGGDYGAGLSTDCQSIADVLRLDDWLYRVLPLQVLVDRCAVGLCVVGEEPGAYVRLTVATVSIGG